MSSRDYGYQEPAEGLAKARDRTPDAERILDVPIPGMSGLDALERLRPADAALPIIVLTAIEYDLLRLFLEHARRVLPKDVLHDRVWGDYFIGSAHIVEVYVKQLRQTLEAASEPRLLHTPSGSG